ncbi:MAG: putative membrane protein [Mariniblastus sp.]|jgi:putative membrane protein
MRSQKTFNTDRQQEIVACIERLETKSSAEIVCAAADESGRYDRAESIIGFVFALLLLGVVQAARVWLVAPGDWFQSDLSLGWQILILVVGFTIGTSIASYWHGLRRLVTSKREMIEETNRAACVVFAKAAVGSTDGRCGLLLYLSLFERRVIVLPDEAVQSALGDERIQQLCKLAIAEIKAGKIENVFETLMGDVEEALAEKLPSDRTFNANELENHLLIGHRF